MGQTNGKITETNISIQDIHDAIEYDSYSVKSLWGSNKINKWSKYKPQDTYTLYGLQYDKMYQLNAQDIVEQLIVPAQRDTFGYPVPKKDLKFSSFGKYYQHCQSPFIQFSGSQVGENKYRIDFGANANVSTDEAQIKLTEIAETNGAYYIVYKTISEGETTYYEFEATKFGNAESDHSHLFENTTSKDVQYVGCVVIAVNGDTNQCIVYPNSFFNFTLKGKNLLEKVDITMQSYSLKKFNDDTYELKNSSIRIQNNNPEEVTLKLEWIYLKEPSDVSLIPEFANTTLVIAKNDYVIFNLADYPDRFTESKGESPFIEIRVFLDGTNLYRDYPQELQAETIQPKANISGSYSNNQSTTSVSGTVNVDAVDGNGDIPANVVLTITAYNGSNAIKSTQITNNNIINEGGRWSPSFSITGIDVRNVTRVAASYGTYGSGDLTGNIVLEPELISISPSSLNIPVGSSDSININPNPADASYTVNSYSSNNTSIATVSSSGNVTGKAVGTCTITVTVTSAYGTTRIGYCSVTVYKPSTITIRGWSDTGTTGDTSISGGAEIGVLNGNVGAQYVYFDVYDIGGNRITTFSEWMESISSTSYWNYATVYFSGSIRPFTAEEVGLIVAYINNPYREDSWYFDCEEPPPNITVTLNKTYVTIAKGEPFSITATPYVDGVVAGSISWSGSGLSLSSTTGRTITVTGNSMGTFTLTATASYNGYTGSASCEVLVYNPEPEITGVRINNSDPIYVEVGGSVGLDITILTTTGETTASVTATAGNSRISVSGTTIYGVSVGQSSVTVTIDGTNFSDSATVYVTEPKKEPDISASVYLWNTSNTEFSGTITVYDSNEVTTNFSCTAYLTIYFGNKNYRSFTVSIDSNGNGSFSDSISQTAIESGLDEGSCSLSLSGFTLNAAEFSADFVIQQPSNNLESVNVSSMELNVGDTGQVSYSLSPSNPDNLSGSVTYSTGSSSIATVSSSGVVTAKSGGSTTITVTVYTTSGSVSGSARITVNTSPPAVWIIESVSTLAVGESSRFYAVADNTSDTEIEWSSGDRSIATVDKETGEVTGVSAGTTTIYASLASDRTVQDSVSITITGGSVTPDPEPEQGLNGASLVETDFDGQYLGYARIEICGYGSTSHKLLYYTVFADGASIYNNNAYINLDGCGNIKIEPYTTIYTETIEIVFYSNYQMTTEFGRVTVNLSK